MKPMLTLVAAVATLSGGAALAAAPILPTYGHYLGHGSIVSATGCPASEVAGAGFENQLELDTPVNAHLIVRTRQVYLGTAPDYVPTVVLSQFQMTHHVHLADAGNVYLSIEGTSEKVTGTYVATYTPLDLNSFEASVTVTYPYTPPGGTAGTCTETTEVAYIRSSQA